MTIGEVFAALSGRGAGLVVRDNGLRYIGPEPLAPDDPPRAGIAEHRVMLIELFTFAREGRCVADDCYRLRAAGGSQWCPDHQRQDDGRLAPTDRSQPSDGSAIYGDLLLVLAEGHGWESLYLKQGVRVGGTMKMWRTFVRSASESDLALAASSARLSWGTEGVAVSLSFEPQPRNRIGTRCPAFPEVGRGIDTHDPDSRASATGAASADHPRSPWEAEHVVR